MSASPEPSIAAGIRTSPTMEETAVTVSVDGQSRAGVDVQRKKRRVWKNIIIISVAFLFNFNAFQGLSRLQSTLNQIEGMGVITHSILYATLMISCLFVPKLMIRCIGHRWTIVLSFFGYIAYMAANGYAVWGTMIPASMLVGLCAAPLWTAQCSYFVIIAQHYQRLTGHTSDVVVSRFFGLFFMIFQASSITGSIISSTALRGNASTSLEDVDVSSCGAYYCPWSNSTNPNLGRPPDSMVWTMVGIYLAVACVAVIIVGVFVDDLPPDLVDERTSVRSEIGNNLMATVRHLRHRKQLLVIPLTIYSGLEQTAFNAELSQAFVGCTLGIWKIGLVTMPFGLANAFVSMASGHAVKYTGRVPVFLFGMCVDLSIQLTLMFWRPSTSQEYVLYILATMCGATDGIWQTQINTLYGTLFGSESEAAFSNYRLWESLGFVVAFAYSFYLCAAVKIYILTAVLVVGMLGYLAAEYLHWKTRASTARGNDTSTVAAASTCQETVWKNSSMDFKLSALNNAQNHATTASDQNQPDGQDNVCFSERF